MCSLLKCAVICKIAFIKFTRTNRNCQSPVVGEERRGEELRQRGELKENRTAEEEMDLQEEKTVN